MKHILSHNHPIVVAFISANEEELAAIKNHKIVFDWDISKFQFSTELTQALAQVHAADIADMIGASPLHLRLVLFAHIETELASKTILELEHEIYDGILDVMPEEHLIKLFALLNFDNLARLLRPLQDELKARLINISGYSDSEQLRSLLEFGEEKIGSLMDFNYLSFRQDNLVVEVIGKLRELSSMPSHTDKLFIVDENHKLVGVVPFKRLLLAATDKNMQQIMVSEPLYVFRGSDEISKVAGAFERYNLISAPVVDAQHRLFGRIASEVVLHYLHKHNSAQLSSAHGIKHEDLFAHWYERFANRWLWILLNLIIVLLVSQLIVAFSDTIEKLIITAALMPIVAGISGSVGNQTATLTIRALALHQINRANLWQLLWAEIRLALINGLFWGVALALLTAVLYTEIKLSIVLLISMVLGFLLAGMAGFSIPLLMQRLGKDPALGTAVLLVAITDTGGFLIFLSLAYWVV